MVWLKYMRIQYREREMQLTYHVYDIYVSYCLFIDCVFICVYNIVWWWLYELFMNAFFTEQITTFCICRAPWTSHANFDEDLDPAQSALPAPNAIASYPR